MEEAPSADKALGQHWLDDVTSLAAIVQAAAIGPSDTVLEIGPGPGSLTRQLLQTGAKVIAVEYDADLAGDLAARLSDLDLQDGQLQVEQADIRQYNLTNLPAGYKLVANIPYYLTAYLLRLLTDTPHKPTQASLLVQKEVAERLSAAPGQLSLIAVFVQFYYEVTTGLIVPAQLFTPPPQIDSQILQLKVRPGPLFPNIDEARYFRIVKAGFSQRRKTLLNTLSASWPMSRAEAEQWLQEAGLDAQRRAQELSLEEWFKLYQASHKLNT